MHASTNSQVAQELLGDFKPDASLVLLAQWNFFRQRAGSNDCGLAFWYVLESLMKDLRRERPKSLYPDTKSFRKQLQSVCRKPRGEKERRCGC